MDTVSSRTLLTYQQEYDRLAPLHQLPTFVGRDFLQEYVLPETLFFLLILTVIFCLAVIGTRHASPLKSKDTVYYIAYKVTHLVGNTMIGIMGYYYYTTVIQQEFSHSDSNNNNSTFVSVEAIATGFKETIYPMACIQLGKNLWAIPAGYLLGNEAPIMMMHHAVVILIAIASCSFTLGFQYYVPLVFGYVTVAAYYLLLCI